jgi:hypothetical protein
VRRNWLVAAVAVVIVAIAAVVLVTRLTDDDGGSLSTTEWADSVCASLGDWRSSITSLADVGGGTLTAEALRERLAEADSATDQLVAELRDLGRPDLEAGAEVEQALDDAASGLQASYESLKTDAEAAADADTPAAFLQELAALAPDFQRLFDQIGETTAALQSASLFGESSAELEQAFSDAESCQALRAES